MEATYAVYIGLTLLFVLAIGVDVALALIVVGVLGIIALTSAPLGPVISTALWGSTTVWSLASLPLFIWMGEILFRTRLSDDMFKGLVPWVSRLPGGLLHVNNFGSGIFAAVCGSSAVTAATIGKITLPELRARGYPEPLSLGTLAGSATLGFLIPPSIPLIVYGVGAEVSIARLFIAGIVPAVIVLLGFVFYTGIRAWTLRDTMPVVAMRYSLRERIVALRYLMPIMLLMTIVIGSIYMGYATPTESAAVGVVGALILSACNGSLSGRSIRDSLAGAASTTCMIGFVIAGAHVLTVMFTYTNAPIAMARLAGEMDLHPYLFIVMLTAVYLLIGCFLEGISIMVLSAAIFVPVMQAMGFDLVWFGIYLVIIIEMALITPPVGFNLFVIQQISKRDIFYITRAALPFFFILIAITAMITVFPAIVTWLPDRMFSR